MNQGESEPKRQGDEQWTTTMFSKRAPPFHVDFSGDNFNCFVFVVVPEGTSGKCSLTNDAIAQFTAGDAKE